MTHLRIATLNLWNFELDAQLRLERAAGWMNDAGIDVLCVQEVLELDGVSSSVRLAELAGWQIVTPVHHDGNVANTAVLCAPHVDVIAGTGTLIELPAVTQLSMLFAAACRIETSAGPLAVLSAHLAWGGRQEPARLAQAQHLTAWVDEHVGADDTEHPAILAGDFNTGPDSDTLRYLTGEAALGSGSLWVDAWVRNTGGDGITSTPANVYATATATTWTPGRIVTLDPSMLPDRRIDFIMSRGWRHGQPFSPYNTTVVREPLMSDHYGLVTDLLLS